MSTQRRVIKEKETFRTEQIVNIDGVDVKFYVKSSVNYERMTYKVQPIITLVHGDYEESDQAIVDSVRECRNECKSRLAQYREEYGLGDQGNLFNQGESSSDTLRSKRAKASIAEAA
jgi:hypothetical protein